MRGHGMMIWDSTPSAPASDVTRESIMSNLREIREAVNDGGRHDWFDLTIAQMNDSELWNLAGKMLAAFEQWADDVIRGEASAPPNNNGGRHITRGTQVDSATTNSNNGDTQ